jgi:hypothetical protein
MSGRDYRRVGYRDELLADRSVQRSYSDGRREWRRRVGGVVEWRDDRGRSGVDEPLGNRLVKRRHGDGSVVYGRELGYGRTAWGDRALTVNETSMGGRVGAILAAVGAAGLLGAIVDPPDVLSAEEEEELRQQAQQSAGSDGGDWDLDGGDEGSDDDWGDPGTGTDSDSDFG